MSLISAGNNRTVLVRYRTTLEERVSAPHVLSVFTLPGQQLTHMQMDKVIAAFSSMLDNVRTVNQAT